jgi:hypothetical protein
MKYNFITFILLLVFSSNTYSQTYPLYNTPYDALTVTDAYYKDMDNDLDRYIGTWRINLNSNSFFEITFIKSFYNSLKQKMKYDTLIGEVKFVENNTLRYDTTSNVTNIYANHAIMAWGIFDTVFGMYQFECPLCLSNEKYIQGYFEDPIRNLLPGDISMKHFTENGVEKIKIKLLIVGSIADDISYNDFLLPSGEYILTKID